jgi:tRNA-dependent cyclodipeptide synthase
MRAKGIETNQAEKKARQKSNNLENKCVKALTADTHIIRWNSIENHPVYTHKLAELEKQYTHNYLFKEHVDVVVRSVLEKTFIYVPDESLYIGSRFLLQELAFISWSPDILGVHETRYIYHAGFDILQNLLSGLFNIPVHKNVSFEIFT